MTLAELNRAVDSYSRRKKREAQEKAAFDYIQAGLIGRNVASYFDKMELPTLQEAYYHLFGEDETAQAKREEKQKAINELSALRFKQFANSFNKSFENKEANLG